MSMSEKEWLEGADPKPMLEFLRGKASAQTALIRVLLWASGAVDGEVATR
jgi:hypothetical protein